MRREAALDKLQARQEGFFSLQSKRNKKILSMAWILD
jgi:hypothetical protein